MESNRINRAGTIGIGLAVLLRTVPCLSAAPAKDSFEGVLVPAWTAATMLSQGTGATPGWNTADGRLVWSYRRGNGNAQQQTLLRADMLPAVGEAIEVTLLPSGFPSDTGDFAGLALSTSGPAPRDRRGVLIFYYEPQAGGLRLWQFGEETASPSTKHSAALSLKGAKTLRLRLIRTDETQIRASWSVDSNAFRFLPPVNYGPAQAAGLYAGNARIPGGNSIEFDDFRLLESRASAPDDTEPVSTPSWTLPDAFIPKTQIGGPLGWPKVRPEARPGAYWWWPGNAVTEADLTWNLETYRKAGWGNMGVIGIYGVRGEEEHYVDIFSPRWFELFNHAVAEAQRLSMNIDLTPGSGWRLGGPHITPEYGEMSVAVAGGRLVGKANRAAVKRAGPGGQGLAVNPYSPAAVRFHFEWLAERFAAGRGRSPRAFYYDSFENPGNWCPELPAAFRTRRGYELGEHVAAFAGKGDPEETRRVLCDYRETLSELLLECVGDIVSWGEERGSGLRMQAHGAPANLLDMYAAASIPETEVFGASRFEIPGYRRDPRWVRADPPSDVVNRFASSAAHVAGRDLVISESFTWLRNHYHTALAHLKAESDRLLLNGITCIYYHGICFAPEKTAWPGWLFYASTQANARNSIFRDVPLLNTYLTRCQSVLQQGRPDDDVLLYWPVYDLWMASGKRERRFAVHHADWINGTPCGRTGVWLQKHGYTFDFASDRQLAAVTAEGNALRTSGGSPYRCIVVPAATTMTLSTAEHLLNLARNGATILFWQHLPDTVPGWREYREREERLAGLLGALPFGTDGVAHVGRGVVARGDELARLLELAGVPREPMVDHELRFIRRRDGDTTAYFVVNQSARAVNEWVPVAAGGNSAVLMDPMTGQAGLAPVRRTAGSLQVLLQLLPGETRVLRVLPDAPPEGPVWPALQPSGDPVPVAGTWHVEFVEGGPRLPKPFAIRELQSWTQTDDSEAQRFAGAARYTIEVELPAHEADAWFLGLGDVRESARVTVNGEPAGAAIAQPFRVDVTRQLHAGRNEIAIEVTNLSANRIRDLDRRGVNWKKFHDINLVDQNYKRFDASAWDLAPSGLLGPVSLQAYRRMPPTGTPLHPR